MTMEIQCKNINTTILSLAKIKKIYLKENWAHLYKYCDCFLQIKKHLLTFGSLLYEITQIALNPKQSKSMYS